MTLLTGGAAIMTHVMYRETVPFTGRTHLVFFSPKEARERDAAIFAEFKKEHASKILSPCDPETVRVRRIAREIITGAHVAFTIKQNANIRTSGHHGGLNWMDNLEWEVIIVNAQDEYMLCFPGAGKIVVYTRVLDDFKTDAEIAACIAHEVFHCERVA
jgi:hypothetical protein